jgi:hypothetical protein
MLRAQETEGFRRVFQRAMARAELAPEADLRVLLSTIAGAVMHRLFAERGRASDGFLEKLIDLLLLGITPRRG